MSLSVYSSNYFVSNVKCQTAVLACISEGIFMRLLDQGYSTEKRLLSVLFLGWFEWFSSNYSWIWVNVLTASTQIYTEFDVYFVAVTSLVVFKHLGVVRCYFNNHNLITECNWKCVYSCKHRYLIFLWYPLRTNLESWLAGRLFHYNGRLINQ